MSAHALSVALFDDFQDGTLFTLSVDGQPVAVVDTLYSPFVVQPVAAEAAALLDAATDEFYTRFPGANFSDFLAPMVAAVPLPALEALPA